jgi:putative MFS transporter
MPSITNDLHLSSLWQGLIGASALIGIFFGGPLGGLLADRIGRKPMFTFDLMLFLAGSIAQFFITEAWQLLVVRLLMGVAIGADYAIGWPLLAEFAPARIRGRLMILQNLAWYVGFLVAYAAGWALTITAIAHWNVVLGLNAIPTVIVLLLRLGTPESPRWLMGRGRASEAQAIAEEYMEDQERADLGLPNREHRLGFRHLFSPSYRRATVFASVFFICNVTPYFAISTFAPVVLENLGLKDGLTGGLALNVLAMLGTLLCALLVDRVGRRRLAIPPFYLSAVALLVVGLFPHALPAIVIACVLTFSFVNAISTALTCLYPTEVFPTDIRGTGVGFVTAMSRIGAAMGTFLLPYSIEKLGLPASLLIAAGISLFGAIVSQLLAPETRGKLLSETAAAEA